MPRAAFSQIVNRSMSEVLTRSIATTSCTLMPILALLFFGGATLRDFAFALLIGVASGAYSSIFIASPVLTHWKEREHAYAARRLRIVDELGHVPAYAGAAADIDPTSKRARRAERLTTPEADQVSAAEFEQMKRDIAADIPSPGRATHTRSITKRLAHTDDEPSGRSRPDGRAKPAKPAKPAAPATSAKPAAEAASADPERAPDIAENEGVAPVQKPKPGASKSRSGRRHGRRR
jgi:SecD/SecF fusion protein